MVVKTHSSGLPEQGQTILVVEDDKKLASALSIRLNAAGYNVVTASDGFKGLSAAIKYRPNLIVMDIWLPGMIGFVVAERLKETGMKEIPVIFTTASKKVSLWSMTQEVGAKGFFEKPYEIEDLLAAISWELTPQGHLRWLDERLRSTHPRSTRE